MHKDEDAQVLNAVIIESNSNTNFIYQTLQSEYSQKQIDYGTSGSVQGVINTESIANLKLVCNDKIAGKYIKQAESLYKSESMIRKENQQLASLRDFLLPMLMNGQVGFKEQAGQ